MLCSVLWSVAFFCSIIVVFYVNGLCTQRFMLLFQLNHGHTRNIWITKSLKSLNENRLKIKSAAVLKVRFKDKPFVERTDGMCRTPTSTPRTTTATPMIRVCSSLANLKRWTYDKTTNSRIVRIALGLVEPCPSRTRNSRIREKFPVSNSFNWNRPFGCQRRNAVERSQLRRQ